MTSDFNIKVGFDTSNLDKAREQFSNLNVGGGTSRQGTQTQNNIAGGFTKALRLTGLISLVTLFPTLAGGITTIVALLGFFVTSGVIAFFKNPFSALIELGTFIVNAVVTVGESIVNAVRTTFGRDPVQLPRFRTNVFLQGVEAKTKALEKAAEDGVTTFKERQRIEKQYQNMVSKSFIKESEYQRLVQQSIEEKTTLAKLTFTSQDDLFLKVNQRSKQSKTIAERTFDAVDNFLSYLSRRAGGDIGDINPFTSANAIENKDNIFRTPRKQGEQLLYDIDIN